MEKQKPHHDLAAFKRSFSTADTRRVTRTALRDAQGLGLTVAGIVEVVQGMRATHFHTHSSMSSRQGSLQPVVKGDLVLDPFGGSGTTGIAAGKLGRRCILIDLLQENCELAQRRWVAAGDCREGKAAQRK